MLLVLRPIASPEPQSDSSRPSTLWLWLAALLALTWVFNFWMHLGTGPLHQSNVTLRVPAGTQRALIIPPQAMFHRAAPDSSNLGALLLTARESSSVGSHYRALRALDFCARQARYMLEDRQNDVGDAMGFPDPRQAAALMQIRSLCHHDYGAGRPDYYALAEEGLERSDPILALSLRLERLSAAPHESDDLQDPARRRELIMRIFATGDPALIGDMASELSLLSQRLTFTIAGVEVEPEAHAALLAALRDLGCGRAGCADSSTRLPEQLLRCAAAAQCDPVTDSAPTSWQRARFLDLLQFSGGRAFDFSYRPLA